VCGVRDFGRGGTRPSRGEIIRVGDNVAGGPASGRPGVMRGKSRARWNAPLPERALMIPDSPYPVRKEPTHGVHGEAGSPTIVFVTACTQDREPWLASAACHALLLDVWRNASAWQVGRFVIMPDHLHLFVAPEDSDVSLERWMGFWKRNFSRRFGQEECRWQRGHWDRRLRTGESYDAKWEYVRGNPVRHGKVSRVEDWPYQGELATLPW